MVSRRSDNCADGSLKMMPTANSAAYATFGTPNGWPTWKWSSKRPAKASVHEARTRSMFR